MRCVLLVLVVISVSQAFPKVGNYFTHPNQRQYSSITPGGRIIGGQDAAPHAYPYQVGIYLTTADARGEFCGGSLVSPNYVLTAAHCADVAVKMELVFGAQDITTTEASQVRVTVTKFIVHPKWKRSTLENDIALVKLSSPIKETSAIKVVKLASGNSAYSGSKGIVTGWGMTFNNQKNVTAILKYLTSTIMTNDDCKKVSSDYNGIVKPTVLCFSGQGPVGTCQGDSGGPLVVDGVQVGIVSFGYNDCTAGFPSVFTRLTEYKDWIAKNSDVKY